MEINLFYVLGIVIVLFAGFNFLYNSQPIDVESGNYVTTYNSSENIEIDGLSDLARAFSISTGNDFIDSLITGLSILLVIAIILYLRGISA